MVSRVSMLSWGRFCDLIWWSDKQPGPPIVGFPKIFSESKGGKVWKVVVSNRSDQMNQLQG